MPDIKLKIGANGDELSLTNAKDLLKYLSQPDDLPLLFNVADGILAEFSDRPLEEVPAGTKPVTASLTVGHDAKWNLGPDGNITLGFSAGVSGGIAVLKEGDELFKYVPGKDLDTGEDLKEVSVKVEAGQAYVRVELQVSIEVSGGADFSNGGLGVNAKASAGKTFTIINNKRFAPDTPVKDAIKSAMENFILPFKAKGVEELNDGDSVDYEFIGKLGFSAGVTYGINGLFLGEGTGGELKKSLASPAASVVAGVKPSFSFGAELGIKYEHEDVFRIVSQRHKHPANIVNLYVLRSSRSDLKASFTATVGLSAGASVNFQIQLDKVIDDAAQKFGAQLPAGPIRDAAIKEFKDALNKQENKKELDKYVKEANDRIKKLLSRVNNQKAELSIVLEKTKAHTALFNYEFDLNKPGVMDNGYDIAVKGDFHAALKVDGVMLLAGSYVQDVITRSTTVSLQFFGLFNVQDITTYFKDMLLIYAGGGVFKLRYKTGVSNEVITKNKDKYAAIYFLVNAQTVDFNNIDNVDVILNFEWKNTGQDALSRLNTISAGLGDASLQRASADAAQALTANPKLAIHIIASFGRDAFGRLTASPFVNNEPLPITEQTIDARNCNTFIGKSRDTLGNDLPSLHVGAYSDWCLFNVTSWDQDGSNESPDRHQVGNLTPSVWPSAWPQPADFGNRLMIKNFLLAAQSFMNLCDDLQVTASSLNGSNKTSDWYTEFLKQLDRFIDKDVRIKYAIPTLLSIVTLINGSVMDLREDPQAETFHILFRVA